MFRAGMNLRTIAAEAIARGRALLTMRGKPIRMMSGHYLNTVT